MRCLVWGAGAIGGTMGAHLARAGHDVTLVDTVTEHVNAINRSGLTVTGPIAEFTARPPAFTPDTLRGAWDTIILATKAQHTETAARGLLPRLGRDGCVISAQNGLNELTIAEIAGETWLLDWKTSKSVAWPSGQVYVDLKLQLAAYARAEFIARPADPTRYAIPPITRTGIVHVTDAGTRLYPADVTEADWNAFRACLYLHGWKKAA